MPRVTIHVRGYRLPATTITSQDYQAFVERLAADTSLPAIDRTAGLLAALYGQTATRLTKLRVDDIHIDQDVVTLALGRLDVELPAVLGGLVTELADQQPSTSTSSPRWLFPGGHPGRPLSPERLGERIAALGLPVSTLRVSALLELAAELPPAFMSNLLGISPQTAVRWAHAAGGEWTNYVATTTRQHH